MSVQGAQVAIENAIGATALAMLNQVDRAGTYRATPSIMQPYIDDDGNDYVNLLNQRTSKWERVRVQNGVASLRRDEWLLIDETLTNLVRSRLNIVSDLIGAGLQYTFDGLSASAMPFEAMSGMNEAETHMRPTQHITEDALDYRTQIVPLPFVSKDYPIDIRQLRQSRKLGNPLDVSGVEEATRVVLEKVERIFAGLETFSVAGMPLYGLGNYPNAYTATISDWGDPAVTPDTINREVIGLVETLTAEGFVGPYWLYLPPNYNARMQEDYNVYASQTIRERLLQIVDLERVEVARAFPANQVVLLNATSQTIRVLNGMSPTTFQWDHMGGLGTTLRVSTIMVPQIRSDYNGKTGIVQAAPAVIT